MKIVYYESKVTIQKFNRTHAIYSIIIIDTF